MYLLKMTGDGLSPADKGRALFDSYALHKMIYAELCAHDGAGRDFLYRQVVGASLPTVYAVSPRVPKSDVWTVQSRPMRTEYEIGDRLAFQLRANPVLERDGRRFGVVMDAIKSGASRRDAETTAPAEWLEKRGDRFGFDLEVTNVDLITVDEISRSRRVMRKERVDMSGIMTVIDTARFSDLLHKGVGRSRAFGYGMLMVKRA